MNDTLSCISYLQTRKLQAQSCFLSALLLFARLSAKVPRVNKNVLLTFGMLALTAPLLAGQPNVNDPVFQSRAQQATQMVGDLGADDYATRRTAFAKLLSLGRPAVEPLEHAQQSEDPEVRLRAMELLIALRGRGFLGVSLAESEDINGDGVPDGVETGQQCVRAMSIVSYQNPQYANLGLNKPLPAEAAGMEAGDKLVAVNDRPVHGTKDLMREVISIGPARLAVITIERNGKMQRLPVVLTRNPLLNRGSFVPEPADQPPVDLEKEIEEEKPEPRAMQTRELEREHQANADNNRDGINKFAPRNLVEREPQIVVPVIVKKMLDRGGVPGVIGNLKEEPQPEPAKK